MGRFHDILRLVVAFDEPPFEPEADAFEPEADPFEPEADPF